MLQTQRALIAGLLLGVAGFAGNWFKYPLFLNIDFLFGSFFVMTALLRYGTLAGIMASLIASSCTWLLWHHPYAIIIFTAEVAFVGILNSRRNKADILIHDILFWIFVGSPLVWIFYHLLLQDTAASARLILLKQSMNGISNALLASIVYLILISREKAVEHLPTYRQVVFTIMVSIVLLPAFIYIFYDLRALSSQRTNLLALQTERASHTAADSIASWLSEHHRIVVSLAEMVNNPAHNSPGKMQQLVEAVDRSSDAFWRMGVVDKHGITVAFSPRLDELGQSTIGVNFSDRSYFKPLRETKRPYVAGVLKGRLGRSVPVVPLLAPILDGGAFNGYCTGVIETSALLDLLKTIVDTAPMHITLLDQFGQVVVSTRFDLDTMMPYPRQESGSLPRVTKDVIHWVPPPEKGRNLMQRWAKSLFIAEEEISPEIGWKVIVENSYAPLLADLRDNSSRALGGLVLLSILLVPVSHLVSRCLTRSLELLRSSTGSLPEDIRNNLPEQLPSSSIREVAELVENFRASHGALQEQHNSLTELNEILKEKNMVLAESEGRFRMLVEVAPYGVFVNRDDRIEYANSTAISLFGAATAEELLGRAPISLFHPECHAIIGERIRELRQGRMVPTIEEKAIALDGTVRDVEVSAVSFVDSRGVAIYVMVNDVTDRKQNEEALITVLQQLSDAQICANAGLWDWDVVSDRLVWSPELYTLFGLDPGRCEASFDLWRQVIHPDDRQGAEECVRSALENRERLLSEYRVCMGDGQMRWISAVGDTIYDDSGSPQRMSGICIDISVQKKAEERLNLLAEFSERLLSVDSPRAALEELCCRALPVLDCHVFFNFMADPVAGRLKLNACSGITDEEMEQLQWLDYGVAVCGCAARDACRVIAADIPNTPDERTDLVRSFGVLAYACHPIMIGDTVIGTLSFGSRTTSSFSDDDLSVMKAMTDLVAIALERKRAEESLARAKREWELTFDSVPDLIAILDQNHRIMRVNRSMAQHLGMEPRECIGRSCHELIHGTLLPPEYCPHTRSLCDYKTHEMEVNEGALKGDFLVSTTPLMQTDGRLIGTVHVARDISDRKRAEMALKEVNDQLDEKVRERTAQLADTITVLQGEVLEREKAQESLKREMTERMRVMESLRDQEKLMILQSRQAAMGEMIGNIAHQWRQPLNILGLLLQQIELFHESGRFNTEFLSQSVSKGMGIIQHMSRTIDDFRNFFRPDKEQKRFSIQETISQTIALISDSFVSHTIRIDVRSESDVEVVGYPNEFSQALLNILLNAKDVLLERKIDGPVISISVDRVDGNGMIAIKDNAGGIPDEIVDRIFDPYFTTKGPQQGTGLGLYMAKMIIEKNMSGKLRAVNGPEGAEFFIEVVNAAE